MTVEKRNVQLPNFKRVARGSDADVIHITSLARHSHAFVRLFLDLQLRSCNEDVTAVHARCQAADMSGLVIHVLFHVFLLDP